MVHIVVEVQIVVVGQTVVVVQIIIELIMVNINSCYELHKGLVRILVVVRGVAVIVIRIIIKKLVSPTFSLISLPFYKIQI